VAFFEAPPSPGYGAFVIVTSARSDAISGIHGPLGGAYLIGKNGFRISAPAGRGTSGAARRAPGHAD
jgi:hypothetical protein